MSVNTIINFIEFFVERLYARVAHHEARVQELNEQIAILKGEVSAHSGMSDKAKRVADKIADLIS